MARKIKHILATMVAGTALFSGSCGMLGDAFMTGFDIGYNGTDSSSTLDDLVGDIMDDFGQQQDDFSTEDVECWLDEL